MGLGLVDSRVVVVVVVVVVVESADTVTCIKQASRPINNSTTTTMCEQRKGPSALSRDAPGEIFRSAMVGENLVPNAADAGAASGRLRSGGIGLSVSGQIEKRKKRELAHRSRKEGHLYGTITTYDYRDMGRGFGVWFN